MTLCSGIRRDGGRCRAPAMKDSAYCLNHDPTRQEENHRNAVKAGRAGGRGRPSVELSYVRHENAVIRKRLLEGELLPGVASVAIQSLNVDIRALDTTLKAREQEQLVEEMQELREQFELMQRNRGRGGYAG
jgi:hypothetical protein